MSARTRLPVFGRTLSAAAPRLAVPRLAVPRLVVALTLAVLLTGLRAAAAITAPITDEGKEEEPASEVSTLQQFTAGGHVLGFKPGGLILSNGRYAFGVSFEGAAPVAPTIDVGADGPSATGAAAGDVPGRGSGPAGMADAAAEAGDRAGPLEPMTYADLWPGIGVTYDTPPTGIVRSTWRLAPGADPAAIRLRYNRPVTLRPDGALEMRFETGTLTESAPLAWQWTERRRRASRWARTIRPCRW